MAKKIIIAEDEKAIAKALELKLTHSGYEAKATYDGEEVLAEMEKNKYDLLLLDLILPKTDGFGVMSKLREKDNKVPIIVLSNLSQEEDTKKAKELGAKDYFVKSNTPLSDIVKYVEKVLGGK